MSAIVKISQNITPSELKEIITVASQKKTGISEMLSATDNYLEEHRHDTEAYRKLVDTARTVMADYNLTPEEQLILEILD